MWAAFAHPPFAFAFGKRSGTSGLAGNPLRCLLTGAQHFPFHFFAPLGQRWLLGSPLHHRIFPFLMRPCYEGDRLLCSLLLCAPILQNRLPRSFLGLEFPQCAQKSLVVAVSGCPGVPAIAACPRLPHAPLCVPCIAASTGAIQIFALGTF